MPANVGEVGRKGGDRAEAEHLWSEAIGRGEAYVRQVPDDDDARCGCWSFAEPYDTSLSPPTSHATGAEAVNSPDRNCTGPIDCATDTGSVGRRT